MTQSDIAQPGKDRPDFLVFPPVLILGTIVLGFGLQHYFPPGLLVQLDRPARIAAGIALLAIGEVVAMLGVMAFRRVGTHVNPFRPATALVDSGIFRVTRNPIYLGRSLTIVGLALAFGADWLLILLVPAFILLHFAVVVPEERYLERKFGARYRQYVSRVPRYTWPV